LHTLVGVFRQSHITATQGVLSESLVEDTHIPLQGSQHPGSGDLSTELCSLVVAVIFWQLRTGFLTFKREILFVEHTAT
jgi:hypothetical protein